MADTSFSGPIRNDTASPGTVAVCRRVSVSADGPSAPVTLPNCDIAAMWVTVETAWQASGGETTSLRVGTSADQTKFGSVALSGVARYEITSVSGLACRNVTAGTLLVVDVTTVGTAGIGAASTYIQYHQLT